MHVDAVQDRTAETFLIAGDRGFSARPGSGSVTVVATGARVACRDQHEFGGKTEGLAGAGNRHHAVLDRLTHDLRDTRVKLGYLVKDQEAALSPADFAG